MKLSEKIYYYRKKAKLSQEELAARVGVSRQAVSKWELGDATPELDKLVALARAFGVTTDELLSPDEPEEAPQEDGAQEAQDPSGDGYSYGHQPGAAPPPPAGWHGLGFLERLIRRLKPCIFRFTALIPTRLSIGTGCCGRISGRVGSLRTAATPGIARRL